MVLVIGLAGVAWLEPPSALTADEAVDAAEAAIAATGRQDVEVDPTPILGSYVRAGETLEVWKTTARIGGQQLALWIARDSGDAVYLDDFDADGSARVLTDQEVGRLARYDGRGAIDRLVRRNVTVTIAAALIAALVIRLLATVSEPHWPPVAPSGDPARRPRSSQVRERPLRAARIEG